MPAERRQTTSEISSNPEIPEPEDQRWHDDVRKTLRDLRKALGITQQELAVRLEKAVVTVARWETSRPPSTSALFELAFFAEEHHLFEIASRFADLAIPKREVPSDEFRHLRILGVPFDLQSALALVLRNQHIPELRSAWKKIRAAIVRALARLVAEAKATEQVHGDPAKIKELHARIMQLPEQFTNEGRR